MVQSYFRPSFPIMDASAVFVSTVGLTHADIGGLLALRRRLNWHDFSNALMSNRR